MSYYLSFQACERVRHLGCLSAQAVAIRYDKSFFILFLFGEHNYDVYEALIIKGPNSEDGNAVTSGTVN